MLTGGFPNTPPNEETIEILSPSCGETLIAGDVVDVEWTGVLPKDVIQLEVSYDNGQVWDTLVNNVVDLKYEWKVPNIISDECLMRAIQLWPNNIGRTMDLPHQSNVEYAQFSRDGSRIITASDDSIVRIWNSNTGELLQEFQDPSAHTGAITKVEYYDDESTIISSDVNGKIVFWDANDGSVLRVLTENDFRINDFEVKDNRLFVASRKNIDSEILIWSLNNYALEARYDDKSKVGSQKWLMNSIELHPVLNEMVITGNMPQAIAFEINPNEDLVETRRFDIRTTPGNSWGLFSDISPDGEYIFISDHLSSEKPGILYTYDDSRPKYILNHSPKDENSSSVIVKSSSFYYDNENKWLITAGDDNRAQLWDMVTGDSIAVFEEHTGDVTYAEFNFDGSRVLTSSWDGTAKVWNLKERDLQMDTTDCTFAISNAILNFDPIFVGEVLVNSNKDTLVERFIFNNSDFEYDVYDIAIEGPSANDFQIISGFGPYTLASKTFSEIEISFKPTGEGQRNAELVITYQGNESRINISGIGLNPGIRQLTDRVDFGEVEIGDFATISPVDILDNQSLNSIEVDSILITGIEEEYFSYAGYATPAILPFDVILSTDIRFTPLSESTFSAILKIYHSGPSSPTNVQLMGQGVSPRVDTLMINIASTVAQIGEEITLPVTLENSTLAKAGERTATLSFDLSFDATILLPLGDFDSNTVENGIRTVRKSFDLNSSLVSGSELGEFIFATAMGMDTVANLKISNVQTEGDIKAVTEHNTPQVKLLGYCEEGGLRLFNGIGQIRIGGISPNPIETVSTMDFSLSESGLTQIFVLDNTGRRIATLIDGNMEKGEHSLEITRTDLPPGNHILVLKTPSDVMTIKIMVR
ncbi:MAG: hypothetical protein Kapaf2KO_17200 [Candidatus Kapaibacteriales bacterium]